MKNLLIIALVLLSLGAIGQTKVIKDAQGNYTAVQVSKVKIEDKDTGKTFIDSKGNKYPVRESVNGKLYYIRVSKKTGNPYRVYLKPEQ
jgi:hypothetical protein